MNDKTITAIITKQDIEQVENKYAQQAQILEDFDRWLGTIRSYGGIPIKPILSKDYNGCIDCSIYLSKCYCRR